MYLFAQIFGANALFRTILFGLRIKSLSVQRSQIITSLEQAPLPSGVPPF